MSRLSHISLAPLAAVILLLAHPAAASPVHPDRHGKLIKAVQARFTRPAKAVQPPSLADIYHRAFQAIASDHPQEAETAAAQGPDRVLDKVVTGYAMALPNNDYSFAQLDGFLRDNPGWPGTKGIQMIAEQKIPQDMPAAQVMAWFAERPPVSAPGFNRYIDTLDESGQADRARAEIRQRWISFDMTGDEQSSFYGRYGALLDAGAIWARMDRVLWKGDSGQAERMMPYVDAAHKDLAEARLALAGGGDPDTIPGRVPSDLQGDPGLLFQLTKAKVKAGRDSEADFILLHPPSNAGNPEAWWDQRQIEVRRAIVQRDFALAYKLAALQGQSDPKTAAQAEFLSGWLALRFLNQADIALAHFQNLYDNATTPITRARGSYWLGRTYEATGNRGAAAQAYQDAATFDTTYYGQLALARTQSGPVLTARADPPLPDEVRRKLMARDMIAAIVKLNDIGEKDHTNAFFKAALAVAERRAEFVVLTEVAERLHRPDLGIQTVKAAAQKNMLLENGGFPVLDQHVPSPPEPAFTHALIRQESMFNPEAMSGVGARGLMQLMPGTARDVARKLDIPFLETRLVESGYSLKLGTAFVEQQIEHFNGSYILALAGYNAGPGRVREWVNLYGDPRSPDIDPVDWVELIPLQETRNYVQRIMESLQVYRAKLAGGVAPLHIVEDLKR